MHFQILTRRAKKILVLKYLKNIGQYDPIRDAELFRVFSNPKALARVYGICRSAGRFYGEVYVAFEGNWVYVPQGDFGSVHRAERMTQGEW